jgi:hypothetical protein
VLCHGAESGLVVWWFGGLVVWWFGGLVVWWFGGLVVWWFGGDGRGTRHRAEEFFGSGAEIPELLPYE